MFSSVSTAISCLKTSRFIALSDDCSAVPSLTLVRDAARITPDDVNFLASRSRGVICAAIEEEHRRQLALPMMSPPQLRNDHSIQFEFTVSVEARTGVTTGISAADRAATLRTLALTDDSRRDLVTPGHIFPSRVQSGGVLVKPGIAEAAVDLVNLAGLRAGSNQAIPFPTAVFAQCLDESGQFLSPEAEKEFVKRWDLPVVSVSELIRYRLAHEAIVSRVADAQLPIPFAPGFRAVCYVSHSDGAEHLALVHGDPSKENSAGEPETVLVRVQSESPFADLFGGKSGKGLASIRVALRLISAETSGVLVYIRHPRRHLLQRSVFEMASAGANPGQPNERSQKDGVGALRELGIGAQILSDLGVRRARILSNSKRDLSGLSAFRIEVAGQTPLSNEET